MYRTMEGTHYKNPELAIEAVLNGFVLQEISIVYPHIFSILDH